MGLFSGKKKIYVSSVLYNLAGDQLERSNYLKTTITGSILMGRGSITDNLQRSYLNGPGIKFRNFFRWAQDPDNYDAVGMPTSFLSGSVELNPAVINDAIPHDPDETIIVQKAEADVADFSYWADQWIMTNDPDRLDTDWETDYNELTGDITIAFDDASSVTFTPTDFDKDALYLYVTHNFTRDSTEGPLDPGDVISIGSDPFPSTTGWTELINDVVNTPVDVHITVTSVSTFSDGRPDETDTDITLLPTDYDEISASYTKTEYDGEGSGDSLVSVQSWMYLNQTGIVISEEEVDPPVVEDIGGGVTKTTIVTTETETLEIDRTYRIDTQETELKSWTGINIYIYKIGSGNTELDELVYTEFGATQYFPFMPIRLDNKYITELADPEPAIQVKKAYKKATSKKLNDIIESIDDNDSIEDIDYAYVAFGVSINVLENSCREYLYRYFKKLMESQVASGSDYTVWNALLNTYQNAQDNWETWKLAQANPSDPLYGTAEPSVPEYPAQPGTSVRIRSTGTFNNNFDMEILWSSIVETTGTGLAKPDAKVGDVWFGTNPSTEYDDKIYDRGIFYNIVQSVDNVDLNWQDGTNSWRSLKIRGMKHRNYIYKGKYVETTIKEGLDDVEESGFLVPLHNPTVREMSLINSTQMCTACCFVVFNCYLVKKQKWYQTGIFKILVVIAIVVITVVTAGTGTAPSIGLLGSAATVGAALGFSGVVAIIVGAIANAIVAMILMKIITSISMAVFGDKFGLIIGTIAGMLAMQVGTSLANGGSVSFNWSELMKADKIIGLTSTFGNVYAQYMGIKTLETLGKIEDLTEDYERAQKEIQQLYADNIGYGNGVIDPMALFTRMDITLETGDSFLTRTLMTGSDVADMSLSMLTNFAELTTSTDLPAR